VKEESIGTEKRKKKTQRKESKKQKKKEREREKERRKKEESWMRGEKENFVRMPGDKDLKID